MCFAFYAEIQDGLPKMAGKLFWGRWEDDSADTLGVKNVAEIAFSGTISKKNVDFFFSFYTEVQDGHQKWWENDYWENVASTLCRYTGGGGGSKILTKSRTISETNVIFMHFTQKFKMAGKRLLAKSGR